MACERPHLLNWLLIAGWRSGPVKKIIIIHTFFLRHAFRKLSKVPCNGNHCSTPGKCPDVGAGKVRIPDDDLMVKCFMEVVNRP